MSRDPMERKTSGAQHPEDPRGSTAVSGQTATATGTTADSSASPDLPAPTEGFVLTHFLTVGDVARSRAFYREILGAEVVMEQNPCILKVANGWIIMNPGGGPTADKPKTTLEPPKTTQTVSSFMNLRVADIQACYDEWRAKGAEFLTAPIDRGAELRCYMRDPDGYLIEVGQSTGLLKGIHAAA